VRKLSTLFLRTLRDDPADAELASHRLLMRAGYLRRVAPGSYSWLPLGLAVLAKFEAIIREEMDAIGAQEVRLPALAPREHFAASGSWAERGENLFALRDRKQAEYLLAPTHEELLTALVKGEYSSYKDYPVTLYRIQAEYRDEARPRAGVLRAREFVTHGSCSFDVSAEGMAASYQAHRAAYERIFNRIGIDCRVVAASCGARAAATGNDGTGDDEMRDGVAGGLAAEEFLAPTPAGEDRFAWCARCGHAANAFAAEIGRPPVAADAERPAQRVYDTPDTPTIETLVEVFNGLGVGAVTAADTLKNVVLKVREPGEDGWSLLVIGVPGDREVDLERVAGRLGPIQLEPADAADIAAQPALVKGYIGPQILGLGAPSGIKYLVDPLVAPGSAWITGANAAGKHAANVVRDRDFTVDGEIGAAEVRSGDPCPRCGSPLEIARGVELGRLSRLGDKHAKAFGLTALGPDGKPVAVTMDSYAIGVSRAVAALAEQTHDDKGLCWPRAVAPADVHIVATGKDEAVFAAAERLATELEAAGVEVIYDDRRGVSPGVKFKDAELIGVPSIIVVGRGLAGGAVELRDRRTDARREAPVGSAVAEMLAELRR